MGRGGFLELLLDVFFPCIFLFANFLFFFLVYFLGQGDFFYLYLILQLSLSFLLSCF